MADVHNPVTRSFNMSRIKGKDTKPEMMVRKFLHAKGFRYRLHSAQLPGKPDLCFPRFKTVVFINGCFWHGHENCKYFVLPKTNVTWWRNKIGDTVKRDYTKREELAALGWKVITIWECQLKTDVFGSTMVEIEKMLKAEMN